LGSQPYHSLAACAQRVYHTSPAANNSKGAAACAVQAVPSPVEDNSTTTLEDPLTNTTLSTRKLHGTTVVVSASSLIGGGVTAACLAYMPHKLLISGSSNLPKLGMTGSKRLKATLI
jgi:hypothetical protein